MTTCYINGKYKPLNQSNVSVTDRGFQFSDGVYEVIAVFKGELVDINLHLNRLFVSLKKMKMKIKFNSCLLYTSPSPRDLWISRMPSSA